MSLKEKTTKTKNVMTDNLPTYVAYKMLILLLVSHLSSSQTKTRIKTIQVSPVIPLEETFLLS